MCTVFGCGEVSCWWMQPYAEEVEGVVAHEAGGAHDEVGERGGGRMMADEGQGIEVGDEHGAADVVQLVREHDRRHELRDREVGIQALLRGVPHARGVLVGQPGIGADG